MRFCFIPFPACKPVLIKEALREAGATNIRYSKSLVTFTAPSAYKARLMAQFVRFVCGLERSKVRPLN